MKRAERSAHSGFKALMGIIIVSTVAWTAGCLDRELKPLNPCLVSGSTKQISVTNVDKVDLLFVVDDSPSMKEEQAAVKEQIPRMISTLVTGMRMPNDPNPFPAAKDLHLGVVSVNMGLVGIQGIGGCSGVTGVTSMQPGFGDDGILRNVPPPQSTCVANVPPGQRFLSYTAGGATTAMQLADNFACLAVTGTNGCGFEQQLESPLKALWPSIDIDAKTGKTIMPNRIKFLTDTAHPALALGHGDLENKGFIRNDPTVGLSLIGILVFTDEEDCSSATTQHFTPQQYLQPTDPLYNQDLNLRCFYNDKNLYPVARYINGFKALRAGNENLVVFASITGVPTDLVDDNAYKAVAWDDDASRNGFYQHILSDPRMIAKPDPSRQPGDGNLTPSCVTATSTATPPARIVKVAQGFGKNGLIRSICEISEFPKAMDAIINIIAKQLGAVCLDRPLVRTAKGTVTCNVVWELPPPGMAGPNTPTACADRPYLSSPDPSHAQTSDRGGAICKVAQLPVTNGAVPLPNAGDGWYYDDFSVEVKKTCLNGTQRAAYTTNAKPPTGVTIKLECLNETQTLVSNRTDLDPSYYSAQVKAPDVGTPCDKNPTTGAAVSGDAANALCQVHVRTTSGSQLDTRMFCHPQLNVCVRSCSSDNDCPPAWVCDKRPDTLAITKVPMCANPTCGTQ